MHRNGLAITQPEALLANYIAELTGCDAMLNACKRVRQDESLCRECFDLLGDVIALAEAPDVRSRKAAAAVLDPEPSPKGA
jgi:hypothetical protein